MIDAVITSSRFSYDIYLCYNLLRSLNFKWTEDIYLVKTGEF